MAKVKSAAFCVQCGAELSADYPCSQCGHNPAKVLKDLFEEPYYISLQSKDIEVASNTEIKNQKNKEELIAQTKVNTIKWFRFCDDESRLAALSDAMLVVQNLLVSNTKPNNLKQILSVAKSIGELSKSIDDYVGKGGAINALPTTTRSGYSEPDPK